MKNNLKQKIRMKGNILTRIIASIALPVIGGINVGCEMTPAEERAVLGIVLGTGLQTSPHASPDERTLGTMIDAGSQASLNSINAKKMGTNVNVNIYDQSLRNNNSKDIRGWIRPNDSFVCRGYKDLNGDGYIGKNELIREGNYFKCGKEYTKNNLLHIAIGSVWENMKGQTILTKIERRGEENRARIEEEILTSEGVIDWSYIRFYKGEKDEGIEEWGVEFYKNGRLDSSKSLSFFIDYGKNE